MPGQAVGPSNGTPQSYRGRLTLLSPTGLVIGIYPAKRAHAFEVIDGDELTLAAAVVVNDNAGYRDTLSRRVHGGRRGRHKLPIKADPRRTRGKEPRDRVTVVLRERLERRSN